MTTCAVIPTFNRRELVVRCVEALQRQQMPVDAILVIDNASTDGTFEAIPPSDRTFVVRSERNTGSAGGFGAGIRWAVDNGFDWIWLIDNDSFPEPEAHGELFAALERFDDDAKPALLASKVVWIDGTILPLNAPIFRRKDLDWFYTAASAATLSIRMAPYAGVLMHRSLALEHGLPIEGYVLWNDDVEYTGRLLRDSFGVLVPQSVLRHEVPTKSLTTADAGARFYFEVRNKLWMARGSHAYGRSEKLRFLATLAVDTARFLQRNSLWFGVRTVVPGLVRGLIASAPRPSGPLRPSPSAKSPG